MNKLVIEVRAPVDRIEQRVLQLRDLRKCGISAVFRPSLSDPRKRNEWCLKAAVLLGGLPIEKFDAGRWADLAAHASASVGDIECILSRDAGWSDDERAEFEPLLQAAQRLRMV